MEIEGISLVCILLKTLMYLRNLRSILDKSKITAYRKEWKRHVDRNNEDDKLSKNQTENLNTLEGSGRYMSRFEDSYPLKTKKNKYFVFLGNHSKKLPHVFCLSFDSIVDTGKPLFVSIGLGIYLRYM